MRYFPAHIFISEKFKVAFGVLDEPKASHLFS